MQQANGGDQNPPLPSQQQQQQQQWVQYQQQQQQWMAAMTYPAANMAMMQQQQMMMYPQHYMAYYQQQQYHQKQRQQSFQKQQQQQPKSDEDVRTIWVGDLQHWMDETYLHSCFALTGEVSSVKIIRNKQTGQPEGYGFVEFYSRETAEKILQSYNGLMMMPNTEHPFRLNWASFSAGDKRTNAAPDLSIFVGDLAPDVTDAMLQETFASRFSSIKGAKVVVDSNTGRSKGYGFVRFGDENEKTTAMSEMNGVFCSSRPMRISVATPKKSSGYQQQYSSQAMVLAGGHSANDSMGQGSQSDGELNNTTIFVGGVDSNVMEEDLRQPFLQFGEVVSVKIPVGKGCGFVQFATRKSAEEALQSLNGTVIGTQTVRLSWGRNQGNKQWRGDSSNRWSGAYHEGQGYGGYGYAASPNQVPNMYATAAASGAS